jgi:hypothetical protein
MPLAIKNFVDIREFLFHSTSLSNFDEIRRNYSLQSARKLIGNAQSNISLCSRRLQRTVCGDVTLQSQRTLIEKNVTWEAGCSLDNFVELLNGYVFFWPGTMRGPVNNGRYHFTSKDGPGDAVILRVPSRHVLNEATRARFSRYNSGSPRWAHGKASPRGSNTFCSPNTFAGTASEVVEVVIEECVSLPPSTQYARTLDGDWASL